MELKEAIREDVKHSLKEASMGMTASQIETGKEYKMKMDDGQMARIMVTDMRRPDASDSQLTRKMNKGVKVEYVYLDGSYGMKGDTDVAVVDHNEEVFYQ